MKEQSIDSELLHNYEYKTGLKNFGLNGLEQLTKLEEIAFDGHGEDVYTLKMIDMTGWIIGALSPIDKSLVGAIEMVPSINNSAFIHGVLVAPEAQGQGLGSHLISLAVKEALKTGEFVTATISPTNGASLNAFLNKNHFEGVSFIHDCYGQGEHRIVVWKGKYGRKVHFDIDNETYENFKDNLSCAFVEEDDYAQLSYWINMGHAKKAHAIFPPSVTGQSKNLIFLHYPPHDKI